MMSSPQLIAEEVDTTETGVTLDPRMDEWWVDLAKNEPEASRALLNFSDYPDESVAFFSQRLMPLKLSEQELDRLIFQLSSDKDDEWRSAFETLDYFDPRLAMDLEYLMNKVTDAPERQRLVEVLSGREPGSLAGQDVALSKLGDGDGYNFRSQNRSWWAEHKVERLIDNGWGNRKVQWTRAIRAINLLEHVGTRDALTIVLEMGAGGHEDALPTKVARQAGLRMMRKFSSSGADKPNIELPPPGSER